MYLLYHRSLSFKRTQERVHNASLRPVHLLFLLRKSEDKDFSFCFFYCFNMHLRRRHRFDMQTMFVSMNRKYSLERMFTNQLLENAQDELSFRTVVRDLQTRSAMLQIIVLNPSSWCCSGYCLGTEKTTEPVAQVALFPLIKVLFSDCCSSNKSEFRFVSIQLLSYLSTSQ